MASLTRTLVLPVTLGLLGGLGPGGPAGAVDGMAVNSPTYYEEATATATPGPDTGMGAGFPTSLHLSDSTATVEYALVQDEPDGAEWWVKIRGLARNHERVNRVYQMVGILPLPADAAGLPAFTPLQWGITPREGDEVASVPFIYGGEKVVLKRNVALERTLLPNVIGPGAGQLPSLEGTGYQYTCWDAILRYDPGFGDKVYALADFRYATAASVAPPDAADERLKAYVVTWIPSLDPGIPPFAVRLDIQSPR